jgi:hypothetical protein
MPDPRIVARVLANLHRDVQSARSRSMQRIMNASQHRVTRWPEISASSMRDPLAGRAGISVGSFRGG